MNKIPLPNFKVPSREHSLGFLADWWIEKHCVIPNGDDYRKPFVPTLTHKVYLANWYRVRPNAVPGERNVAFTYRTGLWMDAQKVGKSPGVAAEGLFEFVGPALFAGRATDFTEFECQFDGCPCMDEPYVYSPGEPMGRPWATPRIQFAAVVEDQVENTWGALVPMIDGGPLASVLKTGEEFIAHPSRNRDARMEIVTSKADSKLGARITRGFCDETGLWNSGNRMDKFWRTLLRGASGMGGRLSQSTNPYDPAENSVAQQTNESKLKDVYKHWFPPPEDLKFDEVEDRKKIIAINYQFSSWVDPRSIEADAVALAEADGWSEAERFFGNRVVPGDGTWLRKADWNMRRAPVTVSPRTKVCLGFDGSDNEDFTGIRLETLDLYQFTPTYGEREIPTLWRPNDWGGKIPRSEVAAAVDELAKKYEIVRAYCDPFMWTSEIVMWDEKYGPKVFTEFATNALNRMHSALERFKTDVLNLDSGFTHDGDEDVALHVSNAIVRARTLDPATKKRRYILGKPADHQKIDFAMSSILAHEAVMDAIAGGANKSDKKNYVYF